ncbi:thiol:disulfide interchange protein DsbA/DsbL [Luteimonas kalidii]|uniref:Thiol:disulfide interchange protein n=1 Tax=Luteimonas kalidii TaxID=3042025 RepID=A0ABT6JWU2_9GAMM|nr:thiol:disulfide interchange protein DsbA/DsbL [Luteimonas kalidii]MDH5835052.1 thiol:disulfide interchange protein DsbA/DsbL [Luteimonas kalidii]
MLRRLSLLWVLAALLPLAAAAQAPAEGTDYVVIADGQRWQPEPGTIEVVEIFAYPCGHCDRFQPMLAAWARTAGDDVRVHYLPAAYDPGNAYARAYFALEALGRVVELHPRLFDAIHREGSLPARGASRAEVASFLAGEGLDAARVAAAMDAPATDEKMNAAREFAMRSGLQGTPTLIINGKYRVQGRSLGDSLRIAEGLIAMERAVPR